MLKNMFEKLFANAGAKIELMAKINFVLWVIAGAGVGIFLAYGFNGPDFSMLLFAIVGGFIGFIIGWLSSIVWFLIGETAKNISMIHNDIANIIKGNSNNNDDNIYDIAKIIKERK